MKRKGKTTGTKRVARLKDLTPRAKAGTSVTGGKKHVTKFKFEPTSFDFGPSK